MLCYIANILFINKYCSRIWVIKSKKNFTYWLKNKDLCLKNNFNLDKLNGLYERNPFLALSISCFLLSLAGAPLFGGFWGKFNIALISYKAYGVFLPSAILLSALISFYYYLKIIRAIFNHKQFNQVENIDFSMINKIIITICVFITIILGINPAILQILT